MFSYDDRLRTVQLCIKLGKRVGLTIRQLGYPTKNALKARHRAYEQRNGLSEGYVRGPKYTQAQKDLGCRSLCEQRSLHRGDDQDAGLSVQFPACQLDSAGASGAAAARGACPRSAVISGQAVRGHGVVLATGKCAGGGRGTRRFQAFAVLGDARPDVDRKSRRQATLHSLQSIIDLLDRRPPSKQPQKPRQRSGRRQWHRVDCRT